MEEYRRNESRIPFPPYFSIAFNSERSIEDELKRESEGEVATIIASYSIMFLYIAVALGEVNDFRRLFVRDPSLPLATTDSNPDGMKM